MRRLQLASCILRLMKVNLLQGTSTPTLTPMPGVHKDLELTASSVRSCVAPASSRSSGLALERIGDVPMNNDHPAALYHLPVRECFPCVWFASSAISMPIPLKLKITFSRNMVVVRSPEGWVLLNPVRLSESAEAELLAQAPFKHAVRLGTYHGRDDGYYVDKFGVEFWGVPGVQTYPEPKFSREITEEGPFPIPGAKVVIFMKARRAECVVNLPQHRLLVTCDSVQHYAHDSLISTLGK